jgi:hypothetical protein
MPDTYLNDREIERIGTAFVARTLPKPEWTHAGHFAAVLYLLRHRPDWDVSVAMPPLIRAYNEATGVANTDSGGYHETITQASIRAARSVLNAHAAELALYRVVNALLESELGRSDWLLRYWSRSILFSVAARRHWVAPDLGPLPF